MCGIIGYRLRPGQTDIPPERFDAAIDVLSHRGPDGRGRWQRPDLSLGLGHRRLSILDTSERGAQPMAVEGGQYIITYNGEVYNFQELKAELEELGHGFHSGSDTEVLLRAYETWGLDAIERFSGIFAFGMYDASRDRLVLARDHLGVKPLFYAQTPRGLFFASEIPALWAMGVSDEPDPEGLDCYFSFSYVPAPLTGCKAIRQLLPGEYLVLDGPEMRETRVKYWDFPLDAPRLRGSEDELAEEFDRLLRETVSRQMVSDVPLGVFLSAGTDSFAIVRAMVDAGHKDVTACSIGFSNPQWDELPFARKAAEALGVRVLAEQVDPGLGRELIPRIRPHAREPFADSSSIPTWQLCEMTRKHVTVALSGEGADELLGGYATHRASDMARFARLIPGFVRQGLLTPLAHRLREGGGKYSLREKSTRFLFGAGQGKWRDHASWRTLLTPELKREVYTPEFHEATKGFDPVGRYVEPMRRASAAGLDDLHCRLYADLSFYLPSDMLVKADRMSMAHGLEVRVPFLDLAVVDFCWRLPAKMKIKGESRKHLLRRVIADRYPLELQQRPKSGFNMEYDLNAPPWVAFDNPFCRATRVPTDRLFGRYHQMMLEYLLAML